MTFVVFSTGETLQVRLRAPVKMIFVPIGGIPPVTREASNDGNPKIGGASAPSFTSSQLGQAAPLHGALQTILSCHQSGRHTTPASITKRKLFHTNVTCNPDEATECRFPLAFRSHSQRKPAISPPSTTTSPSTISANNNNPTDKRKSPYCSHLFLLPLILS